MSQPPSSFKLNTGAEIPAVGLGTWQAKPGEVRDAVCHALKTGYRHLDCAFIYQNENEVGQGIRDSGVKREDIFITSKVWCTDQPNVAAGLSKTLKLLGTDYLDLYLIHWPVRLVPNEAQPLLPTNEDGTRASDPSWDQNKTWSQMEEVYKSGQVKAIGVSNWSIPYLEELKKKWTVVPAVNQVELHPFNPQHALKAWCDREGILLEAYCPLGSTGAPLLSDPELKSIADKLNTSVATLLISYQVNRGVIVLPKSVTNQRITDNLKVISIPAEEMKAIDAMAGEGGKQKRVNTPSWGWDLGFDDWYGPKNQTLSEGPLNDPVSSPRSHSKPLTMITSPDPTWLSRSVEATFDSSQALGPFAQRQIFEGFVVSSTSNSPTQDARRSRPGPNDEDQNEDDGTAASAPDRLNVAQLLGYIWGPGSETTAQFSSRQGASVYPQLDPTGYSLTAQTLLNVQVHLSSRNHQLHTHDLISTSCTEPSYVASRPEIDQSFPLPATIYDRVRHTGLRITAEIDKVVIGTWHGREEATFVRVLVGLHGGAGAESIVEARVRIEVRPRRTECNITESARDAEVKEKIHRDTEADTRPAYRTPSIIRYSPKRLYGPPTSIDTNRTRRLETRLGTPKTLPVDASVTVGTSTSVTTKKNAQLALSASTRPRALGESGRSVFELKARENEGTKEGVPKELIMGLIVLSPVKDAKVQDGDRVNCGDGGAHGGDGTEQRESVEKEIAQGGRGEPDLLSPSPASRAASVRRTTSTSPTTSWPGPQAQEYADGFELTVEVDCKQRIWNRVFPLFTAKPFGHSNPAVFDGVAEWTKAWDDESDIEARTVRGQERRIGREMDKWDEGVWKGLVTDRYHLGHENVIFGG